MGNNLKVKVVFGAGGFIGSHMVNRLKKEPDTFVVGVDLKYPEFSSSAADDFIRYDLSVEQNVMKIIMHYEPVEIYQFAANMGGAGFVFTGQNDADILHNNFLINLHTAKMVTEYGSRRTKVFFSSSACVYPQEVQTRCVENPKLSEHLAYPANPDSEYGWEKLMSERIYSAFHRNYGLKIAIARYHNIYGPEGAWVGGREKAPAAICRKVAMAEDGGEVEVWGDGTQRRSFLYIDDCIDATLKLMASDIVEPINIGSEEMVTINDLVHIVADIAKKTVSIKNVPGPTGVHGRTSDNALIFEKLGWRPRVSLREGLEKTYQWIAQQVKLAGKI